LHYGGLSEERKPAGCYFLLQGIQLSSGAGEHPAVRDSCGSPIQIINFKKLKSFKINIYL